MRRGVCWRVRVNAGEHETSETFGRGEAERIAPTSVDEFHVDQMRDIVGDGGGAVMANKNVKIGLVSCLMLFLFFH